MSGEYKFMTNENSAGNSVKIGTFCIFTYLVSYVSRNILSVVTPVLTKNHIYTKEYIGVLSSIYMAVYAGGQLINGILGDRIKSKYMILAGCGSSGFGMLIFPLVDYKALHIIAFAMLGFGLSMLRGPLMKVIAENTVPHIARTICVLFSAASFAGPLVASMLAVVLPWKIIFIITAFFAIGMALFSFIIISIFEQKKIIHFIPHKENLFQGIKILFTIKNFIFYLIVGAIVEIVASSIGFWTPTYLSEYLLLRPTTVSAVFSGISLVSIISPFCCVFIYEHYVRDDVRLVGTQFFLAAIFYAGLLFSRNLPILNIIFFYLARASICFASAMLWSVFIPKLAKYGKVSSGNGVFDFTGYAAASLANILFSGSLSKIGWQGLIVLWGVIMTIGFAATLINARCNFKNSLKSYSAE